VSPTGKDKGDAGPGPVGPEAARMRLNRFLALCGVASRRKAMELVFAGRVQVNGQRVEDPGILVTSGQDRIELDGEAVRPPTQWVYFAFHKPRGVVVSEADELGREGLAPFLRRIHVPVFPVGRLDRSSEGLLLLTNHGELAHRLLHPRFQVEKLYQVRVMPRPHPAQLTRMAGGVPIGEGEHSAPVQIKVKRSSRRGAVLRVMLREGKKREVRRICRAVGLRVVRLQRLGFAGVRLGELPAGGIRPLAAAELEELARRTGLEL
jgi:23S rRNA pseudouridine2605 synthase